MFELFNAESTSYEGPIFKLTNQVTVTAFGMPVGGEIQFEVLRLIDTPDHIVGVNVACLPCDTGFGTTKMVVTGSRRLTCGCATGLYNRVRLTADSAYIILDAPIGSFLRAIYIGTDLGTFTAGFESSSTHDLTQAQRGCCPSPYCPSFKIDACTNCSEAGYGYRPGDSIDPAATVVLVDCANNPVVNIYPTAGPGHSIPYSEGAGVLGYLANKSDC
jgi:hypothetical protein